MDNQTNFFIFCILLFFTKINSTEFGAVKGSDDGSLKLFVFGDSYADTGNCGKAVTNSWKKPYGFTFPGKPAGRFSDGRVLTDYIASFYGIKSPLPYKWRKLVTRSALQSGMNFAHGGTGVFDTLVDGPNMTTQIDFFQRLLEEKMFTKRDLNSSIALVSLAGNDYAAYLRDKDNNQSMENFTISVVKQLSMNLKRIHSLGVEKIAVTAIEPFGCLPQFAASSSYQNCSEIGNMPSKFHNKVLQQMIQALNNENKKAAFFTLDLYGAFMSALTEWQKQHSAMKNPLQPCCVGMTDKYSCGSIDEKGAKKYSVCRKPELSLFWDNVHPSQNGWHLIYSFLRSSLGKLYY